ncbi:hypothetical protein CRG98_048493 [Punica granatum]|uniref:Uncharacterized protein n=1 Tax=Punica granatum TaxID=22663 RepID=A0A2I0HHG6_PUNGR|nr:hypothetical protein CRG98_048493 [Punica granatum]
MYRRKVEELNLGFRVPEELLFGSLPVSPFFFTRGGVPMGLYGHLEENMGTRMVSIVLRQYIDRFYKLGATIVKFHKDVLDEVNELLFKDWKEKVREVTSQQTNTSSSVVPPQAETWRKSEKSKKGNKKDQLKKKGKSGSKEERHVVEESDENDDEDEDEEESHEELNDTSSSDD